jgi:hypothetical protein
MQQCRRPLGKLTNHSSMHSLSNAGDFENGSFFQTWKLAATGQAL